MVAPKNERPIGMVEIELDGATLVAVWHVAFKPHGREEHSFHQFLMKKDGFPYRVVMVDRHGEIAIGGFGKREPTSHDDAFRALQSDHDNGAGRWESQRVVSLRVDSADPETVRRKVTGFMGVESVSAASPCSCPKCKPRGAA